MIRVREYPLKSLSPKDIILKFKRSLEKKHLDEIVKKIYPFVNNNIKEKINTYLKKHHLLMMNYLRHIEVISHRHFLRNHF